ncbi:MAG TPA: MgtC/SapB family protein [Burkholderiales bacterium]|nr:MgtC/SapB family protein [Burkholderiales bacterium]
MPNEYVRITAHLVTALVAGALIGFERSYHGRPAGFRTHTLVCLASSALMLVTIYQSQWFPQAAAETVRMDPTRMAQGIMTGIGFLGAGVIMKEGLSIRGLTTAASIWITAAIGILAGIGFYFPVVAATALTLATLTALRWVEARMPTYYYARLGVRFRREAVMPDGELRNVLSQEGFSVDKLSYRLEDEGRHFEYRATIRTLDEGNVRRLVERLRQAESVLEFRVAPLGD